MDYIENSNETIEKIKLYWKKYGYIFTTIVAVIFIIILINQWQNRKNEKLSLQASEIYNTTLSAYSSKNIGQFEALSQELMNNYPNTVYASMAAFLIAKEANQNGDIPKTIDNLNFVIKNAPSDSIKTIAKLRLARILINEKNADEAISVLKSIDDDAFQADALNLEGDAYFILNKKDEAKSAYQNALNLSPPNSGLTSIITMKLYDLS